MSATPYASLTIFGSRIHHAELVSRRRKVVAARVAEREDLGLDDIAQAETLAHADLVALSQSCHQHRLLTLGKTHRMSATRTTPVISSVDSATGRSLTIWIVILACCGDRRDT